MWLKEPIMFNENKSTNEHYNSVQHFTLEKGEAHSPEMIPENEVRIIAYFYWILFYIPSYMGESKSEE